MLQNNGFPYISTMKYILISSILLISLASCNGPGEPGSTTKDSLSYEKISMVQSLDNCAETSDKCTYISFNYPQFNNDLQQIQSKIISFFQEDSTNNELDSVQIQFISDYKNFISTNNTYKTPWHIKKDVSVASQNKRWITLSFTDERFTGGAHPSHQQSYSLFSVKDGHQLFLTDFFDSAAIYKLMTLGEPIFCANKKIAPDKSLSSAGFTFPNDHFALSSNFYFSEEGLTFYYNEYEIGPYYLGPTTITIPASSITNLLRKDLDRQLNPL